MNKEKLLELYPDYTSVLGPYTRPDGRKHIVLNNSNASKGTKGKTKTISYPKALKEIELERKLNHDETVDHHDRDFTNDNNDNLKVKIRSLHASEDALRVKVEDVTCPQCGISFTPSLNQRNRNKTENRIIAGPFCSKQCSGLYGTNIQKGMTPFARTEVKKSYYRLDK